MHHPDTHSKKDLVPQLFADSFQIVTCFRVLLPHSRVHLPSGHIQGSSESRYEVLAILPSTGHSWQAVSTQEPWHWPRLCKASIPVGPLLPGLPPTGTDPRKMPCTPNSTSASPFGDPNLQQILTYICTYVYLCTYVRPSEGHWVDEF